MKYQDQIVDWLIDNKSTLELLLSEINADLRIMLSAEPLFHEEVIEQYNRRVKVIIGEEISRQLGIQIDIIFETLETQAVQEYFLNDGLCFNDNLNQCP